MQETEKVWQKVSFFFLIPSFSPLIYFSLFMISSLSVCGPSEERDGINGEPNLPQLHTRRQPTLWSEHFCIKTNEHTVYWVVPNLWVSLIRLGMLDPAGRPAVGRRGRPLFPTGRWTGLPSPDQEAGGNLWRRAPQEADRGATPDLSPQQSPRTPETRGLWAHSADHGVHCPTNLQFHLRPPEGGVGRVFCQFVPSHQTRPESRIKTSCRGPAKPPPKWQCVCGVVCHVVLVEF